MLKPGTKVRTLRQYSETAVICRRSKADRAAAIRYWGSEEKADQWYVIRYDADGKKACEHREMLAVANC